MQCPREVNWVGSACTLLRARSIYYHSENDLRLMWTFRQFARFTKRAPPCGWIRRGQNAHCIMAKCRQTNAAQYKITHEHVSNDLKMWIKRLHTEIHNIITINIHYKSIYFKIITCIILGLVNSNVFACKTNSVFNDFVDSCVTVSIIYVIFWGCRFVLKLFHGSQKSNTKLL